MTDRTSSFGRMNRRQALTLGAGAFAASFAAAIGLPTGRAVAAAGANALTQVRNATLWIDYGGMRFLVDPLLVT